MATTVVPNGDSNGVAGPSRAVDERPVGVPVAPRRPRNTLWMIAGVIIILFSGLAALSIFGSLSARVDVLVAARPIAKGQVIVNEDFRTVSIAADNSVRAIAPERRAELVGQIATGPIGTGSIVHPAQFITGDSEDQQKVIVGAALDAGEYPRVGLRPGDEVVLIEVSSPNAAFDVTSAGPREIALGEVVEIVRLSRTDALLVSIRVNESVAVLAADRAEQGRLRLALIDRGFANELVDPVEPVEPVEAEVPAGPEEQPVDPDS